MDFRQKYEKCEDLQDKVIVIEIYHLSRLCQNKNWTIYQTATDFGLSVGLVSENLHLAKESHVHPKLLECESRQEAMKKIK